MAKHSKQPCVLRRLLRSFSTLIVGIALLAVPAVAAHAAFTASAAARVTVSTGILAAPDAAKTAVTATCTGKNKKHQLGIAVGTFVPVTGANYHSLTIKDPDGVIEKTADLTTTAGRSYSDPKAATGTWTWEIRGDYRVPNTTNVWTGKTLKGTIYCP
jgi:hypothetical protein